MHVSRERDDHGFLSTVQRLQPASIQELCAAVGVTATAVRQRLQRLESEGLVAKAVARQSRGRPSHAYSLTETGLRALGDDHAELAALLWREIMRIDEPDVRERVLNRIQDSLVRRFGSSNDDPSLSGRLESLCHQLTDHGFDVEYSCEQESGGLPILRGHNCPYHEIVVEDASFCELEKAVFSKLLGVPVTRSSWRGDGHRCCEFQVGAGH